MSIMKKYTEFSHESDDWIAFYIWVSLMSFPPTYNLERIY